MRFGPNRGLVTTAVALLCFAAAAHSADGDPARGKTKSYTCLGCHGIESYKNAYPNYRVPRIKGQHADYIIAALNGYKAGERPHATMHAHATSMSDQDMADIAAYLQGAEASKPTTAAKGTAPKATETCVACHGANGSGVEAPLQPRPPVIAGQHADYLQQALQAYRNGRRKNAVMNGMASTLKTDADVAAVASYFASQKSSLAAVPRK